MNLPEGVFPMASAAFQLEPRRAAAQRAPGLRIVRGGRYKLARARQMARQAAIAAAAVLVLVLVTAIVNSQARLTELTGDIDAARAELSTAQSTYDYLTAQMDEIANMSNLGTVAEKRLGLVQTDPSQITYLRLENESVIERSESSAGKLLDGLRTAALSLLGSFDP